jgi:hypothetical protein
MVNKLISEEELFIEGFKQGYAVGWRRVEIAPSDMEQTAKSMYQQRQQQKTQSFGAVIPVEGVKKAEK